MQFVRSSILKSDDGIYSREQQQQHATQHSLGDLDYFSEKDNFVSEATVSIKAKNTAGHEERRAVQEQRISRAQSRAADRDGDSDDDTAGNEFGPAAVTLDEFDFLEAQTTLRRRREVENDRDVAFFMSQQNAGKARQLSPQESLCGSLVRQKRSRQELDPPNDIKKAMAKIKIVKRPRNTETKQAERNTLPVAAPKKLKGVSEEKKNFDWQSLWDDFVTINDVDIKARGEATKSDGVCSRSEGNDSDRVGRRSEGNDTGSDEACCIGDESKIEGGREAWNSDAEDGGNSDRKEGWSSDRKGGGNNNDRKDGGNNDRKDGARMTEKMAQE